MGSQLESTDAQNKLEDLSGIVVQPGENPYDALIRACRGDPVSHPPPIIYVVHKLTDFQAEIQALYSVHRVRRNQQQKDKFLSDDFKELVIDPYLLRLERPEIEPGFKDPRNCLVLWARPADHVVRLAVRLQELLRGVAPSKCFRQMGVG